MILNKNYKIYVNESDIKTDRDRERFRVETIDDTAPKNCLWKITLRKEYVPEVMSRGNSHDINFASIYPSRGLDGTAKACKEKER